MDIQKATQLLQSKEYKQLAEMAVEARKLFLAAETTSSDMRKLLVFIRALQQLFEKHPEANAEVVHIIKDVDIKIYYCNLRQWCLRCQKECKKYCACDKKGSAVQMVCDND